MIVNSYLPAPGMSIHFLPFPDRQNKKGNCIFNLFQVLLFSTVLYMLCHRSLIFSTRK